MLALVEGNALGLGLAARSSRLFAVAVVGLVAFVLDRARARAPMVDFAFFRSRSFLGANIVAFIVTFAMFAMFFFLALYMQNILGYTPLEAGVRFLPSTLVIMVAAPIAGRLADRDRAAHAAGRSACCSSRVALAWQSRIDGRHGLRLPRRPVRPARPRHGLDDVADEHGGDERRRRDQGRRGVGRCCR